MRIGAMGYGYLNNGLIIEISGIKYCNRFLYSNALKFKANGFRLFYIGDVIWEKYIYLEFLIVLI